MTTWTYNWYLKWYVLTELNSTCGIWNYLQVGSVRTELNCGTLGWCQRIDQCRKKKFIHLVSEVLWIWEQRKTQCIFPIQLQRHHILIFLWIVLLWLFSRAFFPLSSSSLTGHFSLVSIASQSFQPWDYPCLSTWSFSLYTNCLGTLI